MKLFHFTNYRNLAKIKADPKGIWKGQMPTSTINGRIHNIVGYQWLTAEDSFEQDWDIFLPPGARATDYRLTIDFRTIGKAGGHVYSRIGGFCIGTLWPWAELQRRQHPEFVAMTREFASSRHWFVFQGKIPREWICEYTPNPTPIDPVEV